MNVEQAIEYIHSARYTGEKEGLRNTLGLLAALGISPTPFPAIHVAGTNGKGSVCAMTASILKEAGLKVGLFTSPFLQKYNERIRINGIPVGDDLLAKTVEKVKSAAETLSAEGIHPTAFELGTATAFSIFTEEKVDIAVLEVGIGGRLDPTNVITPKVGVITALGMDHTAFLGDTLDKIAWEKAGIVKEGVPLVLYPAWPGPRDVIRKVCQACHAPLVSLSMEQIRVKSSSRGGMVADFTLPSGKTLCDATIPLAGAHQGPNALTALSAIETLGIDIDESTLRRGLSSALWPGRLEWILGNGSPILLDGAHNPQGMTALKEYVDNQLRGERLVLLTGLLQEKAGDDMLEAIKALGITNVITVTPDSPRALSGEALAPMLCDLGMKAVPGGDLLQALSAARELAGPDGTILAAGSLYVVGALRTLLGLRP